MPARQFAEQLPPQHLLLQDSIAMLLQFFFIEWNDRMRWKGGGMPGNPVATCAGGGGGGALACSSTVSSMPPAVSSGASGASGAAGGGRSIEGLLPASSMSSGVGGDSSIASS